MMSEKVQHLANTVSYTASGTVAIAGGLSLQDWGIIAGIAFAGLTYITSTIINIMRYRRENKKHK